jgi:hypothetical protein
VNKMVVRKKVVARKKYREGSANHKRFDDKMVTAVLVASGISILILLASFMTVTGHAVSGTPDTSGITSVMQGAELISGDGTMKCGYACARIGKYSILSSVDGALVAGGDVVTGEYACLCASTD